LQVRASYDSSVKWRAVVVVCLSVCLYIKVERSNPRDRSTLPQSLQICDYVINSHLILLLYLSLTHSNLSITTNITMGVITAPPVSVVRDVKAQHALDFEATYDDWRADLIRDGYAVIKGAIPKERAELYVDQVHEFLESV